MKSIKSFAFLILASFISVTQGATDSAQALQVVEAAISITRSSDLDFGRAVQGDDSKTIMPGSIDNAENASFLIKGEAGKSFSVVLPGNDSVKMYLNGDTSTTDETKIIEVHDFASSADQGVDTLGLNGEKLLLVGATRTELLANQERGSYSGTFEVSVVY